MVVCRYMAEPEFGPIKSHCGEALLTISLQSLTTSLRVYPHLAPYTYLCFYLHICSYSQEYALALEQDIK